MVCCFFSFLRYLSFKVRTVARGGTEVHQSNLCVLLGRSFVSSVPRPIGLHFNDERYKIIATQMNSNKFTDFDLKSYKVRIEKVKNLKIQKC